LIELYFFGAMALSAFVALLLTPLVRHAALALNFVDRPGERKIHSADIAYGGGIAVAISATAAAVMVLLSRQTRLPALNSGEDLQLHGRVIISVAAGALGALLLGLVDDKYKLSPRTKLLGQTVLAIGVVAGGVRLTAFIGDSLPMQAVTVLWIVLITNSFNLLDNMDGLCSGTVAIAAAMLGMVALDSAQWNLMIVLAALSGACAGFLRYNAAPAKIFLGDAGSLFVGFVMACATVLVTYYNPSKASHLAIGIPLLVLAIPLYDTASVIFIRLKEGRPIMRGDTSHFSHRLVDLGMSRKQAVTTIHLACLAIGLPATVLGQLSRERGLLIIGQGILVLTIIALLEHAGRNRAQNRSERISSGETTPAETISRHEQRQD
jgi:UDP-GlcNAc:undecaprenyl-phosphate/decaprenyl-phosphate GlcNAc-1-phosphate transferase